MRSRWSPRRWWGALLSGWDSLRASYWFVPTLMAAAAALLAVGALELEESAAERWVRGLPFTRDARADGSRAVLSAVAGSMIAVTGVVFSITIVALTLASSQFGPRLLRSFLRDRGNQLTLGTFVATFLYSMLVLWSVRPGHVPAIATLGSLVLAITSLFVLIYFIHHAASSIQASSVIAAVAAELETQLATRCPARLGEDRTPPLSAEEARLSAGLDTAGVAVSAAASGYVRVLDEDALVALAADRDLLVRLERAPGDFVAAGTILACVGPRALADADVRAAVREAFVLGDSRTAVQDLGFLIDQLTEMAVRALSPGINDPRTAVACVHRLGALMAAAGEREMPPAVRRDRGGRLRLVGRPPTFEDIVATCLDPIRRYGAGHAEVVRAALAACGEAGARCADAGRRRHLGRHVELLRAAFEAAEPSEHDRAAIAVVAARALAGLGVEDRVARRAAS